MRNLIDESADHDRRVGLANDKVTAQAKLVEGMMPNDQNLAGASRLLDLMRQSAATTATNRILFRYEADGK